MVTHAGGVDLPILQRAVGALPTGLFDLQLAAGFVGLGSPSLATLTSILLDIALDKSEQLTDWSTRPLTPAAFRYAADDVSHLLTLSAELSRRLRALGRESWAATECEHLRVAPTKRGDPDTAWWKIKGASSMRGEKARIAQAVAGWRETRAQQRDVPPRVVLSDLALAALTNRPPRDVDEIRALRGVTGMAREVARELLGAVEAGREMDASRLRLPLRYEDRPELDAAVALLTAWVAELASRERIDKKLLATRDDITSLVYGRPSRLDDGWRATLAGNGLRRLLSGDGVLRLADGGRHLILED
jgi:ribonuclease D